MIRRVGMQGYYLMMVPFSDVIYLRTSNGQGNSPSPRQYNWAQQICIFRLELDPTIMSVVRDHLVPRPIPLPATGDNTPLKKEKGKKTGKLECFADDGTLIMRRTT